MAAIHIFHEGYGFEILSTFLYLYLVTKLKATLSPSLDVKWVGRSVSGIKVF